jgi:hypothetical protein
LLSSTLSHPAASRCPPYCLADCRASLLLWGKMWVPFANLTAACYLVCLSDSCALVTIAVLCSCSNRDQSMHAHMPVHSLCICHATASAVLMGPGSLLSALTNHPKTPLCCCCLLFLLLLQPSLSSLGKDLLPAQLSHTQATAQLLTHPGPGLHIEWLPDSGCALLPLVPPSAATLQPGHVTLHLVAPDGWTFYMPRCAVVQNGTFGSSQGAKLPRGVAHAEAAFRMDQPYGHTCAIVSRVGTPYESAHVCRRALCDFYLV